MQSAPALFAAICIIALPMGAHAQHAPEGISAYKYLEPSKTSTLSMVAGAGIGASVALVTGYGSPNLGNEVLKGGVYGAAAGYAVGTAVNATEMYKQQFNSRK